MNHFLYFTDNILKYFIGECKTGSHILATPFLPNFIHCLDHTTLDYKKISLDVRDWIIDIGFSDISDFTMLRDREKKALMIQILYSFSFFCLKRLFPDAIAVLSEAPELIITDVSDRICLFGFSLNNKTIQLGMIRVNQGSYKLSFENLINLFTSCLYIEPDSSIENTEQIEFDYDDSDVPLSLL